MIFGLRPIILFSICSFQYFLVNDILLELRLNFVRIQDTSAFFLSFSEYKSFSVHLEDICMLGFLKKKIASFSFSSIVELSKLDKSAYLPMRQQTYHFGENRIHFFA